MFLCTCIPYSIHVQINIKSTCSLVFLLFSAYMYNVQCTMYMNMCNVHVHEHVCNVHVHILVPLPASSLYLVPIACRSITLPSVMQWHELSHLQMEPTLRSSCLGMIVTVSPSMDRTLPCRCMRSPSHTSTTSPGRSGWDLLSRLLEPTGGREGGRGLLHCMYVHAAGKGL